MRRHRRALSLLKLKTEKKKCVRRDEKEKLLPISNKYILSLQVLNSDGWDDIVVHSSFTQKKRKRPVI